MKRLCVAGVLVLLACASGCATRIIHTASLREDMRTKEVQTLLGNPGATHFNRIADNKIEVWDYIKHSGNITRKARLWFLNDRLKLWQSAEWGIFEPPQLNRPPDFESPHAPEFILEIKKNEA